MTERDIAGYVLSLREALKVDDEGTTMSAAMALLETALIDLHRIADALEHIAVGK